MWHGYCISTCIIYYSSQVIRLNGLLQPPATNTHGIPGICEWRRNWHTQAMNAHASHESFWLSKITPTDTKLVPFTKWLHRRRNQIKCRRLLCNCPVTTFCKYNFWVKTCCYNTYHHIQHLIWVWNSKIKAIGDIFSDNYSCASTE